VTAAVDLRNRYLLDLDWRWQQYVSGVQTTIFYPLAYVNWEVNFYAMPGNHINVLQGITADHSFTRSNGPPPCMDMTNIGYNNFQWTYL
jgi:hypothetical protein